MQRQVKRTLTIFLLVSTFLYAKSGTAQKLNSKWYKNVEISNELARVKIQDAVSKSGYLKFKISIENNHKKNLFYNPSQLMIVAGDSIYRSKGSTKTIKPGERYSEVVNFKKKNLMVDSFFLQNFGISTESEILSTIKIKDTKLPVVQTVLDSNFYLKLNTLKRLNKMTFVKFSLEYKGTGNIKGCPSKTKIKVPSGVTLSPQKSSPDEFIINNKSTATEFSLLFTGPKTIADLKRDPLTIMWEDMFTYVTTSEVFTTPHKIMLDPALTKTENR